MTPVTHMRDVTKTAVNILARRSYVIVWTSGEKVLRDCLPHTVPLIVLCDGTKKLQRNWYNACICTLLFITTYSKYCKLACAQNPIRFRTMLIYVWLFSCISYRSNANRSLNGYRSVSAFSMTRLGTPVAPTASCRGCIHIAVNFSHDFHDVITS